MWYSDRVKKDYVLRVRLCKNDLYIIDLLCHMYNMNRSELIRMLIHNFYRENREKQV